MRGGPRLAQASVQAQERLSKGRVRQRRTDDRSWTLRSAPEQQTGARDAKWNARPLYQTAAPDAFLTVRALFCSFRSKTLHSLTYKQVASLSANIPIERWFDWGDGRIDSLLSDELTDVDGTLMQHT